MYEVQWDVVEDVGDTLVDVFDHSGEVVGVLPARTVAQTVRRREQEMNMVQIGDEATVDLGMHAAYRGLLTDLKPLPDNEEQARMVEGLFRSYTDRSGGGDSSGPGVVRFHAQLANGEIRVRVVTPIVAPNIAFLIVGVKGETVDTGQANPLQLWSIMYRPYAYRTVGTARDEAVAEARDRVNSINEQLARQVLDGWGIDPNLVNTPADDDNHEPSDILAGLVQVTADEVPADVEDDELVEA